MAAGVFHSSVASATLPSGETVLVRIGSLTWATWGTLAIWSMACLMAAESADEVTLCDPGETNTICVWAPLKAGIFACSRSTTCCDSVPGMVMLLSSVPCPSTLSTTTTTTVSSHPASTRRR